MPKRNTKKTPKIVAGALVAAGLASWSYQHARSSADARKFAAPGELVDIGGRRLHVLKTGQGSPAIVVLPSVGCQALAWTRVQEELGQHSTLYIVDRAGLGWSDPVLGQRTPHTISAELDRLISALPVEGPVVLVGHSFGGLIARLYAARYPEKVAGLVLVDSSHEEQNQELIKLDSSAGSGSFLLRALRQHLSWLGIKRARIELGLDQKFWQAMRMELPGSLLEAGAARFLTTRHQQADKKEMLGFVYGMTPVRQEAQDLGDLPIAVLTAGPAGREKWYPKWVELQERLMLLSTNTSQTTALHAGHHINLDDPALVAQVIRELVDEIRTKSSGQILDPTD